MPPRWGRLLYAVHSFCPLRWGDKESCRDIFLQGKMKSRFYLPFCLLFSEKKCYPSKVVLHKDVFKLYCERYTENDQQHPKNKKPFHRYSLTFTEKHEFLVEFLKLSNKNSHLHSWSNYLRMLLNARYGKTQLRRCDRHLKLTLSDQENTIWVSCPSIPVRLYGHMLPLAGWLRTCW